MIGHCLSCKCFPEDTKVFCCEFAKGEWRSKWLPGQAIGICQDCLKKETHPPQPPKNEPFIANCTGWCPKCNRHITYSSKCPECDKPTTAEDEVEKLIKEIEYLYDKSSCVPIKIKLRELVRLAREKK